jgi:hypothetical protein
MSTDVGLVQVMKAGRKLKRAENVGSNDRTGSMQTLHRVDIDVQRFPEIT